MFWGPAQRRNFHSAECEESLNKNLRRNNCRRDACLWGERRARKENRNLFQFKVKLCVLIENYALTQINENLRRAGSRVLMKVYNVMPYLLHFWRCCRLGTCFTRFLSVYTRPSPLSNGIMGREVRLIMTGAMLNVNR